MSKKILVINPGSTSTKIAVFDDEKELFEDTLRHSAEDLSPYHTIAEQTPFRTQLILDVLEERGFDGCDLLQRRSAETDPQWNLYRQRQYGPGLL